MSTSKDIIEGKVKKSNVVYDSAKWHFHNKSSKRIWATLQWLHKNDMLTNFGKDTYEAGYKGVNNTLKITQRDLTEEGQKVMENCYSKIEDSWNKVDTILSRCYKRL